MQIQVSESTAKELLSALKPPTPTNHQVRWAPDAHKAAELLFEQLYASIEGNPKAEKITDQIASLTLAYLEPTVESDYWRRYGMTPYMGKMCQLLHKRMGQVVTKTALQSASYGQFNNHLAQDSDIKVVDVRICCIRKLLKQHNAPYEIETVWGQGYRMKERVAA